MQILTPINPDNPSEIDTHIVIYIYVLVSYLEVYKNNLYDLSITLIPIKTLRTLITPIHPNDPYCSNPYDTHNNPNNPNNPGAYLLSESV